MPSVMECIGYGLGAKSHLDNSSNRYFIEYKSDNKRRSVSAVILQACLEAAWYDIDTNLISTHVSAKKEICNSELSCFEPRTDMSCANNPSIGWDRSAGSKLRSITKPTTTTNNNDRRMNRN